MKSSLVTILPKIFRRKYNKFDFKYICNKLDQLIIDVWDQYHDEFMKLDNNELAATVWGYSLSGELSKGQKQIHSKLNILVQQIIFGLKADSVSKDKIHFIKMLIKNYVAIKFAYLRDVTCLRTKIICINSSNQGQDESQIIVH